LRILHVWDQASTASVIAKWQRKIGHETLVIKNQKHDALGSTSYYGGKLIKNKYIFVLKSVLAARNYDVIHLHDAWFMVVPLRLLYPKKRIIMHYHGSIIRQELKEKIRHKNEKLVDVILVSTPDLLEYDYEKQPYYVPNPVDTDLFKPQKRVLNNKCFVSLKKDNDKEQFKKLMANQDVELDMQENKNGYVGSIQYKNFPDKLAQYEYYADIPIQDGKIIKAHSVCGLQSLAMGLKVINYNFQIEAGLPSYHLPENVVQELEKYYV